MLHPIWPICFPLYSNATPVKPSYTCHAPIVTIDSQRPSSASHSAVNSVSPFALPILTESALVEQRLTNMVTISSPATNITPKLTFTTESETPYTSSSPKLAPLLVLLISAPTSPANPPTWPMQAPPLVPQMYALPSPLIMPYLPFLLFLGRRLMFRSLDLFPLLLVVTLPIRYPSSNITKRQSGRSSMVQLSTLPVPTQMENL